MIAKLLIAVLLVGATAVGTNEAIAQGAQDRAPRETVKETVQPKKAPQCKTVSHRAEDKFGKKVVVKRKVCK